MAHFPISIEDHLKEAGFNPTDILVLRHLLTGQHFTIRELASKTGKSTGLLDQSIKRLLKRGIVRKERVNNTTKYTLDSIDALSGYIQQYFVDHVSSVKRRSQDVSAFFSSLHIKHSRPTMEYFDGADGIAAFYKRLQADTEPGAELYSYMPIAAGVKEDFREELTEFTVFRRRHNVQLLVLTHNTLEARRYQAKDAINNRETRFIDPDRCLLYVEHLITPTAYCCIDYKKNSAQMIVYRELVEAKRSIFCMLWDQAPLTMQEIKQAYAQQHGCESDAKLHTSSQT